jgi:hypothetical protein
MSDTLDTHDQYCEVGKEGQPVTNASECGCTKRADLREEIRAGSAINRANDEQRSDKPKDDEEDEPKDDKSST